MIFVFLLVLLLLYVGCYVVKKEYFENPKKKLANGNKYTVKEITEAVNVLLYSLNSPHYLVRVNYVTRQGAFIEYEALLYNQKSAKVSNFFARVKIPLSSNGKYTLIDSRTTDSNEIIENGVHSIKESQTYGKVM